MSAKRMAVLALALVSSVLMRPQSGRSHEGGELPPLRVLFLGDNGHHKPRTRFDLIEPVLAQRGIRLEYSDQLGDLNAEKLAAYDALVLYANWNEISPEQETALVQYVEQGKGFVPLHCASACFGNSAKFVSLVGGRFARHRYGEFQVRIIDAQHPAMRGLSGFTATDEDYVHSNLATDIHVLMVRDEAGGYEPSCWTRRQGKGRIFYTALGHDEKTFGQSEFHQLVENGIRWAAGRLQGDVPLIEYVDSGAPIPNYTAGKRWGTQGENFNQIAKPLSPELSMQRMHMPEGFQVELFAAEPDIKKPMAGSWDERGRLWIIESVDYPNKLLNDPHENGNDQIKICEDTNADGRADKFTVFADKLNIPTAIVHAQGGVIVVCAPHLLFLKDTDGDDQADLREIILSGFGRGDTHAVPSNLRYGIDNWIWGVCGYSGGKVKVGDTEHTFRQCIFRFKLGAGEPAPKVTDFEVITPTSNNTWGFGFDETGDIFCSTANNQHLVHMAIPNRYFESVRGWHGVGSAGIEDHKELHPIVEDFRQMDWHGGFTAAAGCEVYTARNFPKEYWNRAVFVCEPTARIVHVDWLVPQGSSFVGRDGWNLVASTDPWFGPVDARVGPDGAVWVFDWYNYIIQHNPTPAGFQTGAGNAYETPLRDQKHGRIYRVIYSPDKDRAAVAQPTSPPQVRKTFRDPNQLIAALGDDNMWVRLTAQRLLIERGRTDILPRLTEMAKAGMNDARPATDSLMKPAERSALHARQIILALADSRDARSAKAKIPSDGLKSPSSRHRLAVLLQLADSPASDESGRLVAACLSDPENANDRWIALAGVAAAARHDVGFLEAAAEQSEPTKAVQTAVRAVAEHFARRVSDDAAVRRIVLATRRANAAVSESIVAGLAAGWPASRSVNLGAEAEAAFIELLEKLPSAGQLHLAQLAARMGIRGQFAQAVSRIRKLMLTRVGDTKSADDARVAAARQLVSIGADYESLAAMLDVVTPAASPELAGGVLEALADSSSEELAAAILERWAALTPGLRRSALALLVKRPAWSRTLLDAIEKGRVDPTDLTSDHTQTLISHPEKAIADRSKNVLARKGRLPDPDRQKVLDEFASTVNETGDATAGKAAFTKHCSKCHTHSGEGTQVGPDLTGMAVHPKIELLTNILDPSRSVEGNFRAYAIATKDGRVLNGMLASETKTALELFDTEGKKQVVLREDIDELVESPKSLMPEGFEKQLSREELANLLEFLAARGKYLPIDLRKAATVVSTRGMFYNEESNAERLIFPDWSPKTFEGVPFVLVDPSGDRTKNAILLYGPQGTLPPKMPKSVKLPCNAPASRIHLLSGVSGWGYPFAQEQSVTMIVRLHYADGEVEDHELLNGVHFADYIRVVDVPESKLAFRLRGQQIRYLSVTPKRAEPIAEIELVKGPDSTAPVVMAVTIETPQMGH